MSNYFNKNPYMYAYKLIVEQSSNAIFLSNAMFLSASSRTNAVCHDKEEASQITLRG